MLKVTDFKVIARMFRYAQTLSKSELNFVIDRLKEYSEEREAIGLRVERTEYNDTLFEDDDDDQEVDGAVEEGDIA